MVDVDLAGGGGGAVCQNAQTGNEKSGKTEETQERGKHQTTKQDKSNAEKVKDKLQQETEKLEEPRLCHGRLLHVPSPFADSVPLSLCHRPLVFLVLGAFQFRISF